ncbi:uncharacterized protein LOC135481679 [Liolophura sinensis]|uniref:uncharacterized protein LOC135481679 n=1 Tax=Liolophura sinensis TaxID=3198878 RepID=UPI003158B37F
MVGGSNFLSFKICAVLCFTLCAADTKTNRRTTSTSDDWKERMTIPRKYVGPDHEPESNILLESDPNSPEGAHTNKRLHEPDIVQNFTLELSNSSPAVLDSSVIFWAKLRDFTGHLGDTSKFKYQWYDSEKPDKKVTIDDFTSSITRVYREDEHRAGTYFMRVTVLKDNNAVAVKAMYYNLTGRLNGNMTVLQNLSYQREPNILSTDHPITLRAQVWDKFRSPPPRITYHWFMNSQPIGTSDNPGLNVSLSQPGPKHVTVFVTAKILSDVFMLPRFTNKSGNFSQRVILKDPLNNIHIQGGEAVPINDLFYLNVTCKGSGPTSICWKVTPIKGGAANITCSPSLFLLYCQHLVKLSIPSPGKYKFTALLINDVSQLEKHWYLYVYDPGSVNVPAITVPVVFAFLAVVIIVIGGAYIMKLRKKPYVEVADFDFHPSLTRETEGSRLSVKIRKTVQTLILSPSVKSTPRPVKSTPRPAKSTFKDYGSVEEENNRL